MVEVLLTAAIAAIVIFGAVNVNGAFHELDELGGLLGPP